MRRFVPADGVYRPGDEIHWFARLASLLLPGGEHLVRQRRLA